MRPRSKIKRFVDRTVAKVFVSLCGPFVRYCDAGGQFLLFEVSNPRDVIQGRHFWGDVYELGLLQDISRYLPKNAQIADIGANIGNHAVYWGRVCATKIVRVIEVNPDAIAILKRNIKLNSLEDVVDSSRLGVGAGREAASGFDLKPEAGNLGGTQLTPGSGNLRVEAGDTLLEGMSPDLIKIDVEGMELDVLAGLSRTVAATRPIIFVEVDHKNRAFFQKWMSEQNYETLRSFGQDRDNENFLIVPAEKAETFKSN
ncbi:MULTISPECIES: FkbM family methyltransferase [unclassified Ruegeria]|uniref:FkbM family methyltransferase n=1 Tax=unclassified Ruegeria TaxID=2625375 RepID=UPI00148905AD|nr:MULTISPECIES: FkbM family methyltransferase [unclassified Ruegeria]NOD75386.1 FkbM family methyltransferase [Ruegeria sp. HKCCD4332]NOD87347.1 FkbM family methyltransferase [Ruegeria sp. HKCCD4318]NOE12902.1 FkbM family methyltransferase [Ruegeria sp. HKCCD4318-2]NOG08931.1 FkbM family methyltransferase [Ruegeria sp. HKCCD4315]